MLSGSRLSATQAQYPPARAREGAVFGSIFMRPLRQAWVSRRGKELRGLFTLEARFPQDDLRDLNAGQGTCLDTQIQLAPPPPACTETIQNTSSDLIIDRLDHFLPSILPLEPRLSERSQPSVAWNQPKALG